MEKSIWLLMVDPQADLRDLSLMRLNEYTTKHNLSASSSSCIMEDTAMADYLKIWHFWKHCARNVSDTSCQFLPFALIRAAVS